MFIIMKRKLLLLFIVPATAIALISGVLYPDGSPGGKTGSPVDGAICAQCHISNITEVSWISSNIPDNGWRPGETYTLTLTATPDSANLIGFEVTAESDNQKAGTFILTDTERTRFTNNNKAVTHSHDGTTPTNGVNSWQVDWKAPDEDLSAISFYAAFNAANGDATSEGDHIYASSVSYERDQNTPVKFNYAAELKIYPNPVNNMIHVQAFDGLKSIALFNANGELVKTHNFQETKLASIETANLNRGIYLLKTTTNQGVFTRQILLE